MALSNYYGTAHFGKITPIALFSDITFVKDEQTKRRIIEHCCYYHALADIGSHPEFGLVWHTLHHSDSVYKKQVASYFAKTDLRKPSVYFLYCREANRVKIGFSDNNKARLKNHTTSCPFPLDVLKIIPGDFETEKQLHKRFKHLRRHLEWFEATEELLSYIQSL